MTAGLEVEGVQPGSPLWDPFVAVFCAVFPREAETAPGFLRRYAGLPGYLGLLARADGNAVGMAMGVKVERGNWWVERVAQQLGADHHALQDAFCVVELGVLESFRGRGIGGVLLHELLGAQEHPRAVLSTEVSNIAAQRFYERHGWTVIHPGFVFTPGQEPFCVMAFGG